MRTGALRVGLLILLVLSLATSTAAAETLSANPFVQQGEKLTSAEMTEHAAQGSAVALSADGSTAIIGAPQFNTFAGAAWVYTRAGATWTEQAKLVGKESSALAQQGFSVALSADGNTAIVGAPEDEGKSAAFAGAAWVFTRTGSTWSEQQKLVGTTATTPSREGESVALSASGDTALIGGSQDNKGVGAAWVFTRSGTTWSQQGEKLVGAHGAGVIDEGWSVALSADGETALVGGPGEEGHAGEISAGAAWMSVLEGSSWSPPAKLPAGSGSGEDDAQGTSVALSGDGDTALVGGPGFKNSLGGAWAYTRSGATWTQLGEPLIGEDPSTEPQQGWSVALSESGATALIGGYRDDTSLGAAWAFERAAAGFSEQEKLMGTGAVGGFAEQGWAVALSSDGLTALVGAPADNGGVGAAWVYARKGQPLEEHKSEGPPITGGGQGNEQHGIATSSAGVEDLRLGCSGRSLVLNDAYISGHHVALSGSAAASLAGKTVKILFNEKKTVATTKVRVDGSFSTTAPLPPRRIRGALDTRYSAEIGTQRSLHLKLVRRLLLEPPRAKGTAVTLSGRIVPPLTKPITPVVIEQQLECGQIEIVKTFTPPASGHFHITLNVPAAAREGIYTLKSKVAQNKHALHKGFTTYSLPLPVSLG